MALVQYTIRMYMVALVSLRGYSKSWFYTKNVLIGALIGGVIGGVIGWKIYRKGQDAVNEVITQIEELTEEKK